MFDLIVRNANIISADCVFSGSVAVSGEKIAALLPADTAEPAHSFIDADHAFLFPGFIDAHVHFNDPGFEWREDFSHATQAAALGGVTTVVDMPLQNDPALTDRTIFERKHRLLKNKAYIDYAFWGGMIDDNLDKLNELNECGVTSFKSFLAPVSSDYTSLDYGRVRKGLAMIKKFHGLAGFHCEDFGIISYNEAAAVKSGRVSREDYLQARPVAAELIAVQSIIELSREIGTRVHICHVSHPSVAEAIKRAKYEGVPITAETCPHYLVFNAEHFLKEGMYFKCAPPLRSKEASEALWSYVQDGTLDLIASDHSPCAPKEKSESEGSFKAWGGISGVQTSLQVMFHELKKRGWSPTILARIMSRNPAEIFGMQTRKGELIPGYDADFVLVDPKIEWEIKEDQLAYLNKQSAFIGYKGVGLPTCTVLRGQVIAVNGAVVGASGEGQLIRREC
ncbi:allantoinase AllB [Sporolactobacillus shoreicorticis]|uniref:allantoinase n=1 Tax=Sporolactobacillus shoreicorticis TaxID=1923877 RepID=A0ABW5S810_9BACL|nr:allantoinase AllB [Sporolactobacillus shoreicorticis]MCO7126940.1 allantoinase AllB [Sporolactobacillus shoreicorticis]